MPRQIVLSPVDLVFTGEQAYSVEFLLHFTYPLDEKRLRTAIQKTVSRFFPIQGRLVVDDASGYIVQESAQDVDFQILPRIPQLDWNSPAELACFSQPIASIPGQPLARFRYAQVGEGSAFGVHISHCLVDGYSLFFFLSELAATYRTSRFAFWKSLRKVLVRPDFDRCKLVPTQVDTTTSPHRQNIDPEDIFRRTGLAFGEPRQFPPLHDCQWEFMEFSEADLQALLAEAAQSSNRRLSRHDVVTARLWKRIAQFWPSSEPTLTCSSAFDYRRVHRALSPLYFGNAVRIAAVSLPSQDVLSLPLGQLAEQIRKTTEAIDEKAAQDSLSCIEEIHRLHGLAPLERLHVSHPGNGFLVTNLSRIPLDKLDFGQGQPIKLVPLTSAPRTAVILPAQGGVTVRMQKG